MLGDFNTGKSSLARWFLTGEFPRAGELTPTSVAVSYRYGTKFRPTAETSNHEGRWLDRAEGNEREQQCREEFCPRESSQELLRSFELVDTPGTSNAMSPYNALDQLPRIATHVDIALWCTPAPQAWKDSERRFWLALPKRLRASSLLIVTHIDRIRHDRDLERILERLRRETAGYFRDVVMISAVADHAAASGGTPLSAESRETMIDALGAGALWSRLGDSVSALAANRRNSAERVLARVARAKALPLSTSRSRLDSRAVLLNMWARKARELSMRIREQTSAIDALCGEFSVTLGDFVRNDLGPAIESECGPPQAQTIGELFACDASFLAWCTGGMTPDSSKDLLQQILEQLTREFAEAMG